jgi:hypothetical protein
MTISASDIPYAREDRLSREMSFLSHKRDGFMEQLKRNRADEILRERIAAVEVHICYIYRELECRTARRAAHIAYLKKQNNKHNNFRNRANRR